MLFEIDALYPPFLERSGHSLGPSLEGPGQIGPLAV